MFEWIYGKGPRRTVILSRAPKLTPAEVRARPGLATVVHAVVKLQHMDVHRMANTLRPALGVTRLGIDPAHPLPHDQSLRVQGTREEVIAALQMVQAADVPARAAGADEPESGPLTDPPGTRMDRMAALEARVLRLEKLIAELQRK